MWFAFHLNELYREARFSSKTPSQRKLIHEEELLAPAEVETYSDCDKFVMFLPI